MKTVFVEYLRTQSQAHLNPENRKRHEDARHPELF